MRRAAVTLVLVLAVLSLPACSSDGVDLEGVDVDATFALGPGDEQTPEQFERSCDAAQRLVDDHISVLLDPGSLTKDELRAQVAGLGGLAMEVHEFAPYEQQDAVQALTEIVLLLDEMLTRYDYDWEAMQAEQGEFIVTIRQEGLDTQLSSLIAWVLANCPEGTLQV